MNNPQNIRFKDYLDMAQENLKLARENESLKQELESYKSVVETLPKFQVKEGYM